MTSPKPGDVVLVRFPFTNLTTTKRRPALVISTADYEHIHGDLVLMALSSQDPAVPIEPESLS